MKTSMLKLICCVFSIAFLFSSCLGETNTEIEVVADYAYITTLGSGVQVAAVSGQGNGPMYVTSPQIATLQRGQCYTLGYKISNTSSASGYYVAEDFGAKAVMLNQTMGHPTAPSEENDYLPTSFGVLFYDYGLLTTTYQSFFGDRWIFGAKASLRDKDDPSMEFYYDPNNQKEEVNGQMGEIGDNKIIIDVRFKRTNSGDGAEASTNVMCVGDLSYIKYSFQTSGHFNDNGQKSTPIPIKFRYTRLDGSGASAVGKTETIGNWSTDSASAMFVFNYVKE
ncbi:MAG: hypothetical protein LBN74_04070 [Prevotella sp.]|jgi:hypothetical protein|nr:hypothetical protein [Prevotella sp.]